MKTAVQARPIQPQTIFDFGRQLEAAFGEDELLTVEEDLGLQAHLGELGSSSCPSDKLDSSSHPNNKLEPTFPVRRSKAKAKRHQKRLEASRPRNRQASDRTRMDHVQLSELIQAHPQFASTNLRATNGAYSARLGSYDPAAQKKHSSVEGFIAENPEFQLVEWDGKEARPILDSAGIICSVLAGQPSDAGYGDAADHAFKAIQDASASLQFNSKATTHRRGSFPALNIGVSYGKGQQVPESLKTEPYTELLQSLLSNRCIQRLATFSNSAFQLWQPKVYRYYAESLEKLYKHLPHLPRIFPRSVYPCAAFNFGKNVWCYKHRDVMNCPFGFCAITALGKFDSTQGGHIILWEPKLIIEFPPGSTILIPSATITHSNIPVQEGDARISFTQYCAGGIFRYVDNGFRTQETLKREDPREYERLETLKGGRWEAGLGLLATMDDVKWNA